MKPKLESPCLSSVRTQNVFRPPFSEQSDGQQMRKRGVGRLRVRALVHSTKRRPELRLEAERLVGVFLPEQMPRVRQPLYLWQTEAQHHAAETVQITEGGLRVDGHFDPLANRCSSLNRGGSGQHSHRHYQLQTLRSLDQIQPRLSTVRQSGQLEAAETVSVSRARLQSQLEVDLRQMRGQHSWSGIVQHPGHSSQSRGIQRSVLTSRQ